MSLRVLKVFLVCFFLVFAGNAFAQKDIGQEDLSQKATSPAKTDPQLALEIAHKLANYQRAPTQIITPESDRFILMDIVMRRTSDAWQQPLKAYKDKYKDKHSLNHQLFPVFEAALAIQNISSADFKNSTPYATLFGFTQREDWFAANRAYIVLSVEYLLRGYPKDAMAQAQLAVSVIPTTGNKILINEARYETSDLLHTIFTQEVNIPETIRFTQQLVDLGIADNRKLDKNGILHNITDVFYEMGDFRTANDISLVMGTITDKNNQLYQIWANYDIGRTYLALKEYGKASHALEATLALNPPQSVKISTLAFLAYSYAEQGNFKDSQVLIRKAHKLIEQSPYFTSEKVLYLSRAQALNYANSGQNEKAMTAMTQWANLEVQKKSKALSKSRVDSSNRLAATQLLKNEKIERLEESNKLNKKILMRTYIVAFLLFTVLVLTLIGLAIVWRNKRKVTKLNGELQITNAELLVAIEGSKAADEAKAQFLAVMSHELRTPLNGIISMSDHVVNLPMDPQIKSCVDIIAESSDRLYALIKNVLIAADIDDQVLEDNTSNNLFNECARLVGKFNSEIKQKKLTLTASCSSKLNLIYNYNSNVLDIVMHNLLSNAVKFTDAGEISVHIDLDTHKDGTTFISVKIVDTGIGMDDNLVDKCQNLFFQNDSSITRPFDGAGLGLHVVGKLVGSMGGSLVITSKLKTGTTAHAVFPVEIAAQQEKFVRLAPAA